MTRSGERAWFALLLAWALVLATFPTFDYDLFWHLANGRAMAEQGRVVQEELFSYTTRGHPFANHEWLAQWVYWRLWDAFGWQGLFGFKLAVVATSIALLWRVAIWLGAAPAATAVVGVLSVLAGLFRYTERPHLFSMLGLAVMAFILFGWRERRLRDRVLWGLVPLMLAWDSAHSGMKGAALLGAFVAGETLKPWLAARWPGWTGAAPVPAAQLRRLWLVGAVTGAAMLVDPFGPRSWGMLTGVLTVGDLGIDEFRPPRLGEHWLFFTELALLLGLFAAAGRRLDPTRLLVALPFAVLALRFVRVVGPFGLVVLPLVAAEATRQLAVLAERKGTAVWRAVVGAALVLLAGWSGWVKVLGPAGPLRLGYGLDETLLPAGSARFIAAAGLSGNIYHSGNFGGYFAFTLAPERPIFLYNHPPLFAEVFANLSNPAWLRQWDFNVAVTGSSQELQQVFTRDAWVPVYWEPAAVTLVRRTERNRAVIERYGISLFRPLMTVERVARLTADPQAHRVLAREMADYLAFRDDPAIAAVLADLLMRPNPALGAAERAALARRARLP